MSGGAIAALITRRQFLKHAGAGSALLLVPELALARGPSLVAGPKEKAESGDSVVVQWNAAALQGVRDSKLGPPMVARALAVVHTCVYDAWAAYDRRAIGTRLGAALRRPHREHTRVNKEIAISFAAYRAAVDLFPRDRSPRYPVVCRCSVAACDTIRAFFSRPAATVGGSRVVRLRPLSVTSCLLDRDQRRAYRRAKDDR